MMMSGRIPPSPISAASSGRSCATSTGWLTKACLRPEAVAASAKRWQAQQLGHEGCVGHLRIVAGNDQVPHLTDPRPVGKQDETHTRRFGGLSKRLDIGGRHRAPVIFR